MILPVENRDHCLHNVQLVFEAFKRNNINLGSVRFGKVSVADVVDAKAEKVDVMLWNLAISWRIELLINKSALHAEVKRLERSLQQTDDLAEVELVRLVAS